MGPRLLKWWQKVLLKQIKQMNILKIIYVLSISIVISSCSETQKVSHEVSESILEQIDKLKTAHLNSDVVLADKLYHPNLILTSQSGKKYNKKVALINIKNTFEIYESSEIEFLPISSNVVLTNLINNRKYKDFDKGSYRLTAVWIIHKGKWKIISMQSSKIKSKKRTDMSPIIQVSELFELSKSDNLIIVNASSGPDALSNYQEKHLDGAVFVDLNTSLSEIHEDAANGGRHPLPKIEKFANTISDLGISPNSHVVIYDNKGGANASARFWWMLTAVGHEKVQVLNGGIQEAEKQQFSINSEKVHSKKANLYKVDTWKLPIARIDEVENVSQDADHIVIDVRATVRFNGEVEPIDLIAGHIPGTVNIPFSENLDSNGLFKSPQELKAKYTQLFGNITNENIIFHCGSGVTACHSILAVAYAGLEIPKLYVGSWSEWSRNNKTIVTETKN